MPGIGLPSPGRCSKSPRAMPREIWLSTQVSKDIPGGLRSVIALHRDRLAAMRTTSSREVYRNPWIRVREDRFERGDGSTGLYGVVERPDFTLVIPAEDDGYWLVAPYRYPRSAETRVGQER